MKQDYYEILGIEKSASAAEIKKAYRKKAIEFHPDRNPGDTAAEENFKKAAEAYEVLSDPDKRSRYDRFGHAAFEGGGGFGSGGMNMEDIFSQFGDIFGDSPFESFFGARGQQRSGGQRGSNLRIRVALDLEEIANGVTKKIKVKPIKESELIDAIVICIAPVLCGADGWTEIEEFGKAKEGWFRRFLKLPFGIPSHDTLGRIFSVLSPEVFEARFREWVASVRAVYGEDVIAIDGKTLRRSHDRAAGLGALHAPRDHAPAAAEHPPLYRVLCGRAADRPADRDPGRAVHPARDHAGYRAAAGGSHRSRAHRGVCRRPRDRRAPAPRARAGTSTTRRSRRSARGRPRSRPADPARA